MRTTVVNLNESNGCVYIGRGSKWGNPYRIGKDGTRLEVIAKYEAYIREREDLLFSLPELVGEKLGCYCKPKPCHGDILVKLIRERGLE